MSNTHIFVILLYFMTLSLEYFHIMYSVGIYLEFAATRRIIFVQTLLFAQEHLMFLSSAGIRSSLLIFTI